jgi:CheY-like chemotaxis protein
VRILLIDDAKEPQNIRNPLSPTGAAFSATDVEIARSGEEGVQCLSIKEYDVLLLDNDLGLGMQGVDVLNFLCDHPSYLPARVYLVTHNPVAGMRMMDVLKDLKAQDDIEEYGWIRS